MARAHHRFELVRLFPNESSSPPVARDDRAEREATTVASRVLASPAARRATGGGTDAGSTSLLDAVAPAPARPELSADAGAPLPAPMRLDMEERLGVSLEHVRVHADEDAARWADRLHARAFTSGTHLYYGRRAAPAVDTTTAHELVHAIQQSRAAVGEGGHATADVRAPGAPSITPSASPGIQRIVEVRPPGRGEASAFDRRQELIDRMNTVSGGLSFSLAGREIGYAVSDEAKLTHFDRQMRSFIDNTQVVPMRLITHQGRERIRGRYVPVIADSFISAYVDLDDLLADDVYSFQSDLLHFLTERFAVRDYARLIGTNFSNRFPRAHRAGKDAEAAFLRDLLNDPSIRFNYEEMKPNRTWVNAFRSDEGYRVFQVMHNLDRSITGGSMFAQMRDGRRLTIEALRRERGVIP